MYQTLLSFTTCSFGVSTLLTSTLTNTLHYISLTSEWWTQFYDSQIDVTFLLEWFSNTQSISIHKEVIRMAYICSSMLWTARRNVCYYPPFQFTFVYSLFSVTFCQQVAHGEKSENVSRPVSFLWKVSHISISSICPFNNCYRYDVSLSLFYSIKRFWSNTHWLNLLFLQKIILHCPSNLKTKNLYSLLISSLFTIAFV